ncbi:MAG: primosomal protein N' [Rubellimicrobium sp.]|nr:primosomal protein N' [Rubellimicrobium sp.]
MTADDAQGHFAGGEPVGILTAEPVGGVLDYLAPPGGLRPGAFVEVPLGPRRVMGVVWGAASGDYPRERLRGVARLLDVPPMRAALRVFLERAADYTLTPLPAMLRLATRVPGMLDAPGMRRLLRPGATPPDRMTPARARVFAALEAAGQPLAPADLARAAGVGAAVLRGLLQAGALREEAAPRDAPFPRLDPARASHALTADQATGAARLREAVAARRFSATLLRGVTGSGKTEVYLEAVAECLRQGRQALVLLPEIALTGDFLARVTARFGAAPAEWHSGVPAATRRRLWRMAGEGGVQLVAGARSALFLPFADLGLIVVDEEHDGSYKQEEGVLYNARDMAVLRAQVEDVPVVLASATPSLETWVNAEQGRYGRIDLPARYGDAVLPVMRAVDMRAEDLPPACWVSPTLARAVAARIAAGEQALLFLNRRGYAPVTLCRACGAQIGCDHCDARMVEHRARGLLMCHQCGVTKPVPRACPSCGVEGRLAPVGPGVERLAGEVAALFPEAWVEVLSSDLLTTPESLRAALDRIAAGDVDIIIGTQLVAKGHNFPRLTLVGVIDADLGLQGSDLRAAERTFQLMRQVAGRAGRAGAPGEALLQTFQPEHPVIRAIVGGDEEGFWRTEAEGRRMAGMPPFGRMAGIIISARDMNRAMELGHALARADAALRRIGAEVWGPAPAPVARIRGRHRVRLLVKAARTARLQPALAAWVAQFPRKGDLRLAIDIDPQSFL